MDTGYQDDGQDKEAVLEQLSRTELLSLVKQMIQIYPDLAQLITTVPPAESEPKREPLNPELYHLKIANIFATTDRNSWGSEGRAAEPLLDIVDIANDLVEEQNYVDAATIYELVIQGTLDNYDSFRWHEYEGNLDNIVDDCVDGSGICLLKERRNTTMRASVIQTLSDVYEFDTNLDNDEPVMGREVPRTLIRYTTAAERAKIAAWVRKTFDLHIDWSSDDLDQGYVEDFLLGLEAETLDDDTFLRVSRETENYAYLIERLLKRGRLEEALVEAQLVQDYDILDIAEILREQGHEAEGIRLIEERSKQSANQDLLQWLQKQYEAQGNEKEALNAATRLFREAPLGDTVEVYREIRSLAERLGRWKEVQSEILAYVRQSRRIKLQIQIALDEGQVKEALEILQSQPKLENLHDSPYGSDTFDVGLDVAQAAEQDYPQEAIEIYQKYVETRIAWRDRHNYSVAVQYLISIRKLFQKIGRSNEWTTYIMELRGQHRKLPALKDEMAKAGL